MVGIKIGSKKTKVYGPKQMAAALRAINWKTHSLLCHNTQFDGFILSHHYGIVPAKYYDTLSMARGLHSNEIGASLDEVAQFYSKGSKVEGALESTKGILNWPKPLYDATAEYCIQDVELTYAIFREMHPKFPAKEADLVHAVTRMFCVPVLRVDIPRVQTEYEREVTERKELMLSVIDPRKYDDKTTLKTKAERALTGEERDMLIVKRVIGSNEKFIELLAEAGVRPQDIPRKPSPAYIKKSTAEKLATPEEDKWIPAFSKDDLQFTDLPDRVWELSPDLDLNDPGHVLRAEARRARLQQLVDVRLAVKSTTNITRAERFLTAGANGMRLPVGYAYSRAHTHRLGGNNKMNMQNLTRGGELRLSILAAEGHQLAVVDSGQIEARVNAWLWDQTELLDAFRDKRDIYSEFATKVYGRTITKEDKNDRHVGKVCLAEDTRVLTNRGLLSIIEVETTDLLWDGIEWVKHDGLIYQGFKEVQQHKGLRATADHEILTALGWQEWSVVRTSRSLFQSALSLASLPSYDGITGDKTTENSKVTAPFAGVRAATNPWLQPEIYERDERLDAMSALSEHRRSNGTGPIKIPSLTTSTDRGSSIVCPPPSLDVLTQTTSNTNTTASAALKSMKNGEQIVRLFWTMFKRCLAGMTQRLSLIASTTTTGISPVTSGSQLSLSIPQTSEKSKTWNAASENSKPKTHVYDLANAGPRNRFTVMTDDGPVIVHNCVLGLGFQMGPAKFQITLAKGALGGPKIAISMNEAHRVVNLYRRENYKIADGWATCKDWISIMANPDCEPVQYKCLTIEHERIRLPNGLYLQYPDLQERINENGYSEWTYQSGDMRKKIYGGLLTENIVQALARIIVMEQLLEIDKKYPVVMTTHDEVVAHPKTAQAQKCFDYMMQCMTTSPWWCPDLPLAAEGGFASNYSK